MSALETIGWAALFEDIFPRESTSPTHQAAARVVTDPHSLQQDRLHDHAVEVEVIRRRKDWKPGEEDGRPVRLPLADIWTHLERFDTLEIGAPRSPQRPVVFDAVAMTFGPTGIYAAICWDWRGAGAMAVSKYVLRSGPYAGKQFGDVLVRHAKRSGVQGAKERLEMAVDHLNTQYGKSSSNKDLVPGYRVAEQAALVAIFEHFTSGAIGCFPSVHGWFIYRAFPDPAMLASVPIPETEKDPAGVLADKIGSAVAVEAWGATHADAAKARQWETPLPKKPRKSGNEDPEDDDFADIEAVEANDNASYFLAGNRWPAVDSVAVRLAEDAAWPSDLVNLACDGYPVAELVKHGEGFREHYSLTEREHRVLFLDDAGYSVKEIAEELGVSLQTIYNARRSGAEQIRDKDRS